MRESMVKVINFVHSLLVALVALVANLWISRVLNMFVVINKLKKDTQSRVLPLDAY